MYKIFRALTLALLASSLSIDAFSAEVNVYSARKENLIKPLLDKFSAETGIKTNLITAKADKLLTRMINEGRNTPADILITTDAGRLFRAKNADLLQPIKSSVVTDSVPAHLRDVDDMWVSLSQRSRVIFYATDRVLQDQLSTYEDLADPKWKNRICIRGSGNIYNQSLVASMISVKGKDATLSWAKGLVNNLARKPSGGDRDQIKAAAAGQCDLAVANTYYYAQMLENSKDPAQKQAAEKMALLWPNQNDRGAHVNVSGAAISKYSKNRDSAVKLIEFLLSKDSQQWYGDVNFEYPVVKDVAINSLLRSWGNFKSDTLNLSQLGDLNADAVRIMDKAGWK
ncbi:MAG: Fe(3+) ABC transporter substrate-binding protein [Gammaproteobacteria bacterium]|nr:Fe(3+) ABC transporter substrate-binding protein [Gammaproteobacteria bacterium]